MMMFKTVLFASVVTLIGSTLGRALPYQQQEIKLAIRDIGVVGVRSIPAQVPEIVVRGEHVKRVAVEKRQIAEETPVKTNNNGQVVQYVKRQEPIPAEIATKSDGGKVVPYSKRQIAVEQAVKSDGGAIVPYPKRQIDVEQAVKSDGGAIVPYPKRQIDVEQAVKSDGGAIVPYPKRQIDVEQAVKSDGGAIVPYPKRQLIPAEDAVKSENGVISPY